MAERAIECCPREIQGQKLGSGSGGFRPPKVEAFTKIMYKSFMFWRQNAYKINAHITSCARGDTICPRPARCTHSAAHLQSIAYTPYACGAQCALRYEYS